MISSHKLRVVVVDEELPYPPISGKRIRTLNLLLQLASRHKITYLCYRNTDPSEAQLATEFFRDHGMEVVLVDRPTPAKSALRTDPRFYLGLARNLFSRLPYLVAINDSQQLQRAVWQHVQNHEVDLWQCEWTPFVQSLRHLQGQRLLVMAHNVESLIWQRYYETETNFAKRCYIHHQWRKMERFENWAFAHADRVVTVSQEDAVLVRRRFGREQVDVVDNGVDTEFFSPGTASRQPGTILFLGSLDWRPNLDGVRLLLEKIFPRVRSQVPSARLSLVGRNPPAWLTESVRQHPQVELHANVVDVRPHLNQCSVMAVPLRIGGGSRLKILEALATGTPVVSTQVGAEGLRLRAGEHFVAAEAGDEMAHALVGAMRDRSAAQAMALRGRDIVLGQYDWRSLASRLDDVWKATASEPAGAAQIR